MSSLFNHGAVAVAVSGGADSLHALLLLRERGLDVFAAHAFFRPPDEPGLDETAARLEVFCKTRDIPFKAWDLHREFDALVIEPFSQDYAEGRTPNPCARCNARMKFGLLFDKAQALGATRLATGHYAGLAEEGDPWVLRRGADAGKDQSYFLTLVPAERLGRALFPLAGLRKSEVLDALRQHGIEPPAPTESQEICFIPNDEYRVFLQQRWARQGRRPAQDGPIVLQEQDGGERVLGRHAGLWKYTPGQRRGLGVAWSEPLYALGKDVARNALLVGPSSACMSEGCVAGEVNFLVPFERWPQELLVQTRYRQKPRPARVEYEGDRLRVAFATPDAPPAAGQVLAVYSRDGVALAGAVLEESLGRE
jgi:tRNA-specific 2-thiouridylase